MNEITERTVEKLYWAGFTYYDAWQTLVIYEPELTYNQVADYFDHLEQLEYDDLDQIPTC